MFLCGGNELKTRTKNQDKNPVLQLGSVKTNVLHVYVHVATKLKFVLQEPNVSTTTEWIALKMDRLCVVDIDQDFMGLSLKTQLCLI